MSSSASEPSAPVVGLHLSLLVIGTLMALLSARLASSVARQLPKNAPKVSFLWTMKGVLFD